MFWKIFGVAFSTIFLAELGDKTQLAAIFLVAEYKSPLAVFGGAVLALASVTLVGVTLGETITKIVPRPYLHWISGLIFIILGLLILFRRL